MATALRGQPSPTITYTKLLELLPSYMEDRGDAFKLMIPTFVNLAENRIITDMKQQGFQAVVTGRMGVTNVLKKPSFWRETLSFSYVKDGRVIDLKLRSLEYVKRYWPNVMEKDAPTFYADYNANHFYLAATPDEPYPFELVYYARLEPLSASNNVNWLTTNAPQVLLYACLLEAAMWKKNPAAEQKWMQQYAIATGGQVDQDSKRKEDRNLRVKAEK